VSACQSRLVRRLEAAYQSRVARCLAAGFDPEDAHALALAAVKALGREALSELRRRDDAAVEALADLLDAEPADAALLDADEGWS
jgi:hypothetical protein